MKTMYEFHNVSQEEDSEECEIRFTLSDHRFSVTVRLPSSVSSLHQVNSVFHEFRGTCPICKGKGYQLKCTALFRDLNELFEQLISTNALRLYWLFVEYKLF